VRRVDSKGRRKSAFLRWDEDAVEPFHLA